MKVPISMIPSSGAAGVIAAVILIALVAYAVKQASPTPSNSRV